MLAVMVLVEEDGSEVEVTVIRRRVDRPERGPGLARLEPVTVETEGVELAEVIPMRRRAG